MTVEAVAYYAETVEVTRAEMQKIQMALGAAGDYLAWLQRRGVTGLGDIQVISQGVREARELALYFPTLPFDRLLRRPEPRS